MCTTYVSTTFFYSKTKEMVYVIARNEFGEHDGKRMIIDKVLYELVSSTARFHDKLRLMLGSMEFESSKANIDLWIKDKGDRSIEGVKLE